MFKVESCVFDVRVESVQVKWMPLDAPREHCMRKPVSVLSDAIQSICQHAVLGALPADAASLGLHWLYDTKRLREVEAQHGGCEFLEPGRANYEGHSGYFAHETQRAGDLSHYGEGALVMLRSLTRVRSGVGGFDARRYENEFRKHFGAGGEFRGYIDNATRLTLDNLAERDRRAITQATVLAKEVPEEVRRTLALKVIPYTRQFSGDALLEPVARAVRVTYDDERLVRLAHEMAKAIDRAAAPCGADDNQVSAIAKLPPLVALYAGQDKLLDGVEAAVRVTNNNNEAVAYARVGAKVMEAAMLGANVPRALAAGLEVSSAGQRLRLERAMALPSHDPTSKVHDLGQACFVTEALPVTFYILSHWTSFPEAIRLNIRMGGDSCGRALILGAVLGATHGVGGERGIPLHWLLRVPRNREAAELLAAL